MFLSLEKKAIKMLYERMDCAKKIFFLYNNNVFIYLYLFIFYSMK